jgi:hypothetical protein
MPTDSGSSLSLKDSQAQATDRASPSPSRSNDDIPRNILAFRTITTMLASIQQGQPFKFSLNDSKLSAAQQQELKISNALANLAIADHEIVAVATAQRAEELSVFACSPSESNDKSPPPKPLLAPQPDSWLKFIVSKNPRKDDKREDSKDYPLIYDAKVLAEKEKVLAEKGKGLAGFGDEAKLRAHFDDLDGDEAKLRAHIESCR